MPYSLLLSEKSRSSIGLSLKNALVIVDEAHNVPEALCSLSAIKVTLPMVEATLIQLTAYTERYSARLAGRNLFYISQIRRCLIAMKKFMSSPESSKMMSKAELIFALRLDNINFVKLDRYLTRSGLPQKLLGFMHIRHGNHTVDGVADGDDPNFVSKHISPLSILQQFFLYLTSGQNEGKIAVEWPSDSKSAMAGKSVSHPTFRHVLLNPPATFSHVTKAAHTIVLAGGTMRPFAPYTREVLGNSKALQEAAKADDQLSNRSFKEEISHNLCSKTLTTYTCSHVVPSSHVNILCLSSGPTSTKLDLRHAFRDTNAVCDELGRVLFNLSGVVPSGLVVFLPSYKYEKHAVRRWKETGIWDQIKKRKKVFIEPKSAREVEETLKCYSNDASSKTSGGALLLSVVGGKMSEGINFADEMCRCVLVAGLPYPDITSPELKEKMKLLDTEVKDNGFGITGGKYYHNLCMRAINQSIGRSIRHINDYAAVVLADTRYAEDRRVWLGLPEWLRGGSKICSNDATNFGKNIQALRSFFKSR